MPLFPYRNIIPLKHLSLHDRQIVIGKHSGKAGIINKFKEYNIELNDEEAQGVLEMVRAASVRLKRTLFDKELVKLYKEYKQLRKEKNKEN